MKKIPLYCMPNLSPEFDVSVKTAQDSHKALKNNLPSKPTSPDKVITGKGMIATTSFKTVGTIIGSLVLSKFNDLDFKTPITAKELHKWKVLLNTDWEAVCLETVTVFNRSIGLYGIKHGTKRFKREADCCILTTEGIRMDVDFKIDKAKHWPTRLKHLKFLFIKDKNSSVKNICDQILRTVLGLSRLPEDFKELDISSITSKGKIDKKLVKEFREYVHNRVVDPETGFKVAGTPDFIKYGVRPHAKSSTSGPNGELKLKTASFEASCMLVSNQHDSFKALCSLTGNIPFYEYVKRIGERYQHEYEKEILHYSKLKPSDRPREREIRGPKGLRRKVNSDLKREEFLKRELARRLGKENLKIVKTLLKAKPVKDKKATDNIVTVKPAVYKYMDPRKGDLRTLTSIRDTGNKSRTVAIVDVWTQLLLTPFENKVILCLNSMFGDVSSFHNHQRGWGKFKKHIRHGIRSIDLTAWTDHLSADLQQIVVSELFNDDFAREWRSLVVDCDWFSKSVDGPIRYGKGQGMGTKGSFAIASLTDHFLTEFLLSKHYPDKVAANPRESLYNRVGDDLWIWDPDEKISDAIANEYLMPINKTKSKYASDENLKGEFVSMNMNHGKEVSRISMRVMLDMKGDLFNLPRLISHLEERHELVIGDLLYDLYSAKLHPKKAWESLFKSLSLETIVSGRDELKDRLRQNLMDLNKRLGIEEGFSINENPYGELIAHPLREYILLILEIYGIRKNAREIESQLKILRGIPDSLIEKWRNRVVDAVKRDATIWDTKLQLHELITWCQFVDSSDNVDSLRPETLVWSILSQPDVTACFKQLDLTRKRLEEARSDLTFSNFNRLLPINLKISKLRQFVKLSSTIVIDTNESVPRLYIDDSQIVIDEFLDGPIIDIMTLLNNEIFLKEESYVNGKTLIIDKKFEPGVFRGLSLNELGENFHDLNSLLSKVSKGASEPIDVLDFDSCDRNLQY